MATRLAPSIASVKRRLREVERGTQRMAAVPLDRLEKALGGVEKLKDAATKIHFAAAQAIIPDIRAALAASLSSSGIGNSPSSGDYKPTGSLRSAVMGAQIKVSEGVIRITMAGGKSAQFYARAGALNFGSVRGSGTSSKRRAKLKKTLDKAKEKTGQKKFGSASTTKAFHFFKLTDSQMATISKKYAAHFQKGVDAQLASKGK